MQTYMGAIATEFPDIQRHREEDFEWGNEGRALVKAGQLDAAITKFKMVARSQPKHHEGSEELAYCYEKLGQIAEARYFMGEALLRARSFLADGSLDQDVMDELLANYARMDPVAYAQMSTEALVQAQCQSFQWPDPALLHEVIKRGADAVPHLRQILREDEDGLWYSDFAAKMLATLYGNGIEAAAEAIPEFVAFFEKDVADWIDFLSDYLSIFGEHAIDPLLTLVQGNTLEWYPQTMAIDAAVAVAGQSPDLQARVAEGLRSCLAQQIAAAEANKRDPNIESLISGLADLRDEQARNLIKQAYSTGLTDGLSLTEQDYEELMSEPSKTPSGFDMDWLVDYENSYATAVYDPDEDYFYDDDDDDDDDFDEEDDNFDEEDRKGMSFADVDKLINLLRNRQRFTQGPVPSPITLNPAQKSSSATTPRSAQRQTPPSRNEPCWCGSGKKYKYCHLSDDEAKARH